MKNPNELFIQDYAAESVRIENFIQDFFDNCPRKKVILGLSGGLDSAVVASLCCRALGPENVHAVLMPAPNSSQESYDDAMVQTSELKIPWRNVHRWSVKKILRSFGYSATGLQKANLDIGNTAARIRMTILFKIADEVDAIVSGTENLTEHLLGYFTIGGDEVSLIEPIRHLYKTEVENLAKYLGVIAEIRAKKPSAELWEGQTDEDELGFSYRDADIVLKCHLSDLKEDLGDYNISNRTIDKILKRYYYTKFKRNRPFCIKR